MTLEQIRNIENVLELEIAVNDLVDNSETMTVGECTAMSRLISMKAQEYGISVGELNDIALNRVWKNHAMSFGSNVTWLHSKRK